ncbi:GIY-YIG nuclease family protein, partial [Neisseria sp. P0022.S010]
KYTRLNKPVEMRIVSDGLTKSEALKREIGIKKLTAEQKRGLWAEAEIMIKD